MPDQGYIYIYIYIHTHKACDIMVIIRGDQLGNLSSNPGQGS